jgi:hypothetical protein
MSVAQRPVTRRVTTTYTARHRHHLPGHGYTDWSEGVPNGRHGHALVDPDQYGHIEDSVGSPAHRHAWSIYRTKRVEHGYTSGPALDRPLPPPVGWLVRFLHR